ASLRRVLIGLLLGSLAAVLTGSLAFYLRIFRNLTFPTITMLAPIAPAAWIPLAILAFGMGDGAAIFVVFVGIYFTLTLATLNNMNNVDQLNMNLTFLGMAIIGLVGYLLDVGLGLLQKRMLWWRSAARI